MGSMRLDPDEDVVRLLRAANRPAPEVARGLIVTELYRRGAISSGRAAERLGMDRFAFVRHSPALGIPFFEMTEEEWGAELQTIADLTASPPSFSIPAP